MVKTVSILGSTGSIGKSTVDIIRQHPDKFQIKALTANGNVDELVSQAKEFAPEFVAIADESKYQQLKTTLPNIRCAAGEEAICEAASVQADFVMAAIVGFAGLKPTMQAIEQGATIGLANKEALVCAGELMIEAAKNHNAKIIPVDSEHNAIYQIFDFENPKSVSKIILTASGGPFLGRDNLDDVTPQEAVNHPNWDMGAKISVDSATMMNKGLEMIEAYHLFPVEKSQIEIIIHPESVIHSMVEYNDGSVLSQSAAPDMRVPISYALGYPKRLQNNSEKLNLAKIGSLNFFEPDMQKFPCLALAKQALQQGGSAPVILNAANEVAVERFLNGEIKFTAIPDIIEKIMSDNKSLEFSNLDELFNLNAEVRIMAEDLCKAAA